MPRLFSCSKEAEMWNTLCRMGQQTDVYAVCSSNVEHHRQDHFATPSLELATGNLTGNFNKITLSLSETTLSELKYQRLEPNKV